MLNKLISLSLHNRIVVLAAAILLMVAGSYVAHKMEVDVFPDLNAPTVVVMTEARGMAPEEVEQLVTFPIETAVNGATGVRRVRSSSTTGFSIVWVEFDWDTDIYRARQIVAEKMTLVADQLPPSAGSPTLGPQSSILGELMFVALTADSTSMQTLRRLADWTIRPRLLATGGVAQVAVIGGEEKEYQIMLKPHLMSHYGVGLNEVLTAVEEMNRNTTGGIIYQHDNEYIVRGIVSTQSTEELGMAVVSNREGSPLLLRDIADIGIGNSSPKTGVASLKGKPCVMMTVTKQPGVSTLELTEEIDHALEELHHELPADVQLSTDIYRQERFINSSISNVKNALIEGAVLVVLILLIFLMNIRTTVISLVTIPLSLLISLLTLHLMGYTINTMSLGGMAIAIGSLVDDAIVDVENVYKRLRENYRLPASERRSIKTVVFDASREVRMPILSSTLIIIVSFVPLFFLTGMEGRLLLPLGIAFITALCASTLVALTLTPVLCSYLLGREPKEPKEPPLTAWLKRHYLLLLDKTLHHRRMVVGAMTLLLLLTIVIASTLGSSFLPPFNEGSFTINVSTLPGISLEASDEIGRKVEQQLLSIPEIQTVGRKTGRAELDEHALGVNVSEIEAPFVLDERSKEEVMDDIRHRLAAIPGINVEVGAPITHRIDAMLSGTQANIAIKVFGDDLKKMHDLGQQIKEVLQDVDGLADLNVEQQVERPQLQLIPRRQMLAYYGLSMPEFARMVSVLLAGEQVSTVIEGKRSFNLTLRVDEEERRTMEDIREIPLILGDRRVPLGELAEVRSTVGPNTINRENVMRKLVISANVSGRDLSGAVEEIREVIDKHITIPDDCHIAYGGQFENAKAASQTLLITSLMAVLIIFLLLYQQFRHLLQSAVILLNLPLALIGGVMAVRLSNGIVSIPAIIGFISLFGIATRNGMLLIARYNDLMAEGLTVRESVLRGSADRLAPILMTALTSALALIPLVIGGDLPGNEIQSPMAKVILGGLFTSTLLNALLIPITYIYIHQQRQGVSTTA